MSEMARISTAKARLVCAFGNSARPTPAISSATRMAGNDSITSHRRMRNVSTQPPRKPASRPSVTPIAADSATAATPTTSEMRAP